MSVARFFGKLYSPDTLDSRFSTSAVDAVDKREDSTKQSLPPGAKPSKWQTPEFLFYGLVFVIAIPWMFKSVVDVSQPYDPYYSTYEHLLSPGWIPGRKVDNSDHQYAAFRDNLPYLFLVLLLHPLLRRGFNAIYTLPSSRESSQRSDSAGSPSSMPSTAADHRLEQRIIFDLIFGLVFLVALHGFSALKVLLILYINYLLATRLEKRLVPVASWVFNVGILFANEFGQGYRYEAVATTLFPGAIGQDEKTAVSEWAAYLDSVGGLMPRWEVLFNITILRLISFNLDYYWSRDATASSPLEKKQLDPAELSERDRVYIPAKAEDYSFRNYLAYAIYSPLYLAGPILTFNDYIAQVRYKSRSVSSKRNLLYGLRLLLALLSMEITIHYIYVVAISKSSPSWNVYTPFQLSMLGYFNLQHIWLKLLLPWRFFRLWSLLDGIDPPENVIRCMSDNYSTIAFWRGWHRSYNRWIVRYIYVPMGGSGGPRDTTNNNHHQKKGLTDTLRSIANVLMVFTFVAIWHDIQLRLLAWGWLVVLFFLPELVAGWLFPARRWKETPEAYRRLCAFGTVGNILMMMISNLVGFALGLDGLKDLLQGILGTWSGPWFLLAAFVALYAAAQVIFEWREREKRLGYQMKC